MLKKDLKVQPTSGSGNAAKLPVSGCLSHEETKQFYQLMLRWEKKNLIDYSLMEGADYMQRTLAKRLGIDYKPQQPLTFGCMRRFACKNFKNTTELDSKLSYIPCYTQYGLLR